VLGFESAIALQLCLKIIINDGITGKAKMIAKDKIKAEIDSLNLNLNQSLFLNNLFLILKEFGFSMSD
jgi:hypothetical protein